jgi:tetratricopeptide (TPR) repeat protein
MNVPSYVRNLGRCFLVEFKKFEYALDYLDKADEMDPEHTVNSERLASLLAREDSIAILADFILRRTTEYTFIDAGQLGPKLRAKLDDPAVMLALGKEFHSRRNYRQAIYFLDRAATQNAENAAESLQATLRDLQKLPDELNVILDNILNTLWERLKQGQYQFSTPLAQQFQSYIGPNSQWVQLYQAEILPGNTNTQHLLAIFSLEIQRALCPTPVKNSLLETVVANEEESDSDASFSENQTPKENNGVTTDITKDTTSEEEDSSDSEKSASTPPQKQKMAHLLGASSVFTAKNVSSADSNENSVPEFSPKATILTPPKAKKSFFQSVSDFLRSRSSKNKVAPTLSTVVQAVSSELPVESAAATPKFPG